MADPGCLAARSFPMRNLSRGRRKLAVLSLGAVGLAGALTVAAFAAPDRAARAANRYTPDYPAARASCAAVAKLPRTGALVAATCEAPLDGLAGHADAAYTRLSTELARTRTDRAVRGWSLTTLAELAIQQGNTQAAQTHL